MRSTTLFLAMICICFVVSAQQITFENAEYDFGNIPERGESVTRKFEFTNTGTAPLVITRSVTSCNCTKILFGKKPIMPGQKGTVTVTYNPNKQSGTFFKAIQIYSNDPRGRQIITVKGRVID